MKQEQHEYEYHSSSASHTQAYLWPVVERNIPLIADGSAKRIFDLGCGNGAFMARLRTKGYIPSGVDPSESGVQQGKAAWPDMDIRVGSAYDDLSSQFGQFPIVVSLEVVEHVYAPRDYAKTLFRLVEPGGIAIVTTPYHGYLKNLVLAATGKMDSHFTALWDHGHIKFWSVKTLSELLQEAGFRDVRFEFAGRISWLAKSMVAIAKRP